MTETASVRRSLALSTAEGATATALIYQLTGTFLTAFVLFLGGSPWLVGLAAALQPAMQMSQTFLAYFVERLPSRRRFLVPTLISHRMLWVAAGGLALLLPAPWKLPTYLTLYSLSWLLAAPAITAWQSLMTDFVPPDVRGRYFGLRWTICTVVGLATVLEAGWVVDTFEGATGFALLFGVGLLFALANAYFTATLPEVPSAPAPRVSYWKQLQLPFNSPRFRHAVWWLPAWSFVQQAAPPFYTVMMAKQMGLSYGLISVLAAVTTLTSAAAYTVWGRGIDRLGPFRLAALGAASAAAVPLLWLLAGQAGVWYLFPLHALQGIGAAALQTIYYQVNMQLAPPGQRSVNIAVMNGVNGAAGFLGPLLAGVLAETGRFGLLFALAGGICTVLALVWQFRLMPVMEDSRAA